MNTSRDRTNPIGYKLSVVEFENGSPVAPSNSSTALIDIMANADNSKCPDSCFRPVGLAWDSKGRLFMSSDATGEIYVIVRSDGTSADGASSTNGLPSSTVTGPSPTGSKHSGAGQNPSVNKFLLLISLAVFFVLG
jgi:hypothetical protein